MAVAICPHCRANLQVSSEFTGRTLECPKCRGKFDVPREETSEKEALPLIAIFAGAGVAHVLLFVVFGVLTGPVPAVFLVGLVILSELAVWKRNELLAIWRRVRQSQMTKQVLETAVSQFPRDAKVAHKGLSRPIAPPGQNEIITAEVINDNNDELVEIRPARPERSDARIAVQISFPHINCDRSSMRGQHGGQSLKADLPKDGAYFFGPDSELDLGRGVLKRPLVYATGVSQQGNFDASLIDGTLPVASPDAATVDELPYWPNYFDCSPAQRSRYLAWLLSGKCDPNIELGYVFIYFYGLERRVLVDRADYFAIAQELIRLLPIYDSSNSFRRYVSALLWLTLCLASQSEKVPQSLFHQAISATARWNDDLLAMCLAVLHNNQQPLPADVAYLVGQNDSRSSSSIIVRRHQVEFLTLFEKRYRDDFGDGIQLRASKRDKRIGYHPASGTLLRTLGAVDGLSLPSMPNILAVSSQFKQIVQSWDQSIEELKAFSRASRASGGELSAEAYEALPTSLQEGNHPEQDAWMQAWEDNVDAEGWPVLPVSTIASIKGFGARDRLTKTQCSKLLATADAIGLGVEPDARMTGMNYRWDERVTFFFLEGETAGDVNNYFAASALLRLGASVAEADGSVDKEELTFITDHLEGQFNLSNADSKRLERLQYLLLHSRSGDNTISKVLAKRLPRKHRLLVGEFLVGVAAVDGVITEDEIKVLRKAYRSLDLDPSDLDNLITFHTDRNTDGESPTLSDTELRLDMEAISRIMTETRQVAEILRDAMADDDEQDDSSLDNNDTMADSSAAAPTVATVSTTAAQIEDEAVDSDLDRKYGPFLKSVLDRDEWTASDLRELADKYHLMLSGAVEAINEWSMERYGDWLIEEGDTYQVRQDLIEESQ